MNSPRDRGFLRLIAGDGRPLLAAVALALLAAGGFAVFVAVRGEFLPHDTAYLGITPQTLCQVNRCRIVHFMVHDRVAFGGALMAIGVVYLWLVAGPLGAGRRWAWELLAASGATGFVSFLAYLGYGYLDTWHGVATLALLPLFISGLTLNRSTLRPADDTRWLVRPPWWTTVRDRRCVGRALLVAVAVGMVCGGATIAAVGMTTVFVPDDTAFLGMDRTDLDAVNPRLVPLIAHDRAGFGGAVCCGGLLLAGVGWRADLNRSALEALALAGVFGFGGAILVHLAIGYTNPFHLAPAVVGAALFTIGLALVSSVAVTSRVAQGKP